MSIAEVIKANRPNISESTVRTYVSIIKNFAKQMGIELENAQDVITNYEKIIAHVKHLPANVRKTRLSAIVVFIQHAKEEASDALKALNDAMSNAKKEYNEEVDNQVMTEKQKETMKPWSYFVEKYHELEKQVEPLLEKDDLTKAEFAQFQMYVILSCNILLEPRRSMDWTEFKLRNVDKENDNYISIIKRKPYLVFNKYKTAKKMGRQVIPCPKKLYKILYAEWMLKNKHDWLLMNANQTNKINSTQYTKLLYHFFGEDISTNIMRHSYLTSKYKDVPALKEMKQTAKNMAHTLDTALTYVKK
jgi:hypothetical protein